MTGKRMRKNPHGWMLAAVLLLAAAGLLAVHSHQTAAVPPEEPAQEEPSVTVIPAEPELPELPEEPVEEDPVPEKPWGPVAESALWMTAILTMWLLWGTPGLMASGFTAD